MQLFEKTLAKNGLLEGKNGASYTKDEYVKEKSESKSSKKVFGVDSSSDKPATIDSNSELMRSISSSLGSFGVGVSLTLK